MGVRSMDAMAASAATGDGARQGIQRRQVLNKTKSFGFGTAVLAAVFASGTTGAFAHATEFSITGKAWGVVTSDHYTVEACDLDADGKGVRMDYILKSGYMDSVGDANGSSSGCGKRTVGSVSNPVTHGRLCLSDGTCTNWVVS
jgi:hypothetical protein